MEDSIKQTILKLKDLIFKAEKTVEEPKSGKTCYADMIVFNNEGKFLILLRSRQAKFEPGKWCLPGGHVDEGEDHASAAMRELLEETGIDANIISPLATKEIEGGEIYFYECKEYKDELFHLDNDEHINSAWILPEEIEDYEFLLDLNETLTKLLIKPYREAFEIIKKAYDDNMVDDDVFLKALEAYNLAKDEDEDIEKGGKPAELGDRRIWGGKEFVKHQDGWIHLSSTGNVRMMKNGNSIKPSQEHIDFAKKHFSDNSDQPTTGGKKEEKVKPEESASNEKLMLGTALLEEGLEITSDKNMPNKTVKGNELPQGSLMIWGGSYNKHPYHDPQDQRIPTSKITNILKKLGLEDKYTIKTETYDPGSEKGWKVEAQYHYLIPTDKKEPVTSKKPVKEKEFNTATVKPGDKNAEFGMGGDRKDMISWPRTNSLQTPEGLSAAHKALTQMNMRGRARVLEAYQKTLDADKRKAKSYQEIYNPDLVQKFINSSKEKYLGSTNIKEGKISISIDSSDNTLINGKKVYVDKKSSYVKLGTPGNGSSVGAFYGGGHFDGQLQGAAYPNLFDHLIADLRQTGSLKEAIKNTGADLPPSYVKPFEKLIEHLNLKN
jgi:8-oxo-dGTP pyrophosphatase MutT (NUDIX family)